MENLTLKIRIAVLWIFMAVAVSAESVLFMFKPGVLEQIWEMQMSAGMFLLQALYWLGPLTMAFLSVTLKDSANRWANIIMGIVFTVYNIVHVGWHLPGALIPGPPVVVTGSTVVVAALIVWYAWKWPKKEA